LAYADWRIVMNPIEIGGAHVQTRACTIGEIQSTVAYFFGMSIEQLYQKRTTQEVVVPRQIAMYLARQITDASLAEIGRQFGGMHSRTVTHSIVRVETQRKTKAGVELALRIILESLRC
jgi:chromosomal replication initiator protein